jgi:serine/threonine protein kinase
MINNSYNRLDIDIQLWKDNRTERGGKVENEKILMRLIQDKTVSDTMLYTFMNTVEIRKDGGWFSPSMFSRIKKSAADQRIEIFERCRNCSVEAFFEQEKQKLELEKAKKYLAANEEITLKPVNIPTLVPVVEEHIHNPTFVDDKIIEPEKQIAVNTEITLTHVDIDLIQLAQDLGIKDQDNLLALERLEKDPMIPIENLKILVNQTPMNEKIVMLNTLVAIGKELGTMGRETERYIKRKLNYRVRISHAFAISERGIFIVPKKQVLDDTGSLKVISEAIKLENNHPSIRAKIRPFNHEGRNRIEAAKNEYELLKILHSLEKDEETSCLVPAYECCMLSENGKEASPLVMFQSKLNGNGSQMQGARAKHQLQVYKDIATALAFLHEHGYVHMDVKPGNFLIEGNLKGERPVRGKLCDFDLACPIGAESSGGDPAYLAPELLSIDAPSANPKIDSYSLGLMIYFAVSPRDPSLPRYFKWDETMKQAIQKAKELLSSTKATEDDKRIRSALLNVAQKLMVVNDPNKRISCQEAVIELNKI